MARRIRFVLTAFLSFQIAPISAADVTGYALLTMELRKLTRKTVTNGSHRFTGISKRIEKLCKNFLAR